MTNRAPIFLCGPSRSGTTMLQSALNRHPEVHLTVETHYFDDLRLTVPDPAGTPLEGADAERVARALCACSHRTYGQGGDPELGRIRPAALHARARALGATCDAYFRGFCELEAELEGKRIWGEKTPRHVFRTAEILEAFPNARIVCLVRDPRAVVASYRDWKPQGGIDFESDPGRRATVEADHERARRSYHPAIISMLWKGQARGADRAVAASDRAYLLRYEDLVGTPEVALRGLAEWLGIGFRTEMLEVPVGNSSYEKFDSKRGIITGAAERWRAKLTPGELRVIERICAPEMARFGYEPMRPREGRGAAASLWATLPVAFARAFVANRERMGSVPAYLSRRWKMAFGS